MRSDFWRVRWVVGMPAETYSGLGVHSSFARLFPGHISSPAFVPEPAPFLPSSGSTSM